MVTFYCQNSELLLTSNLLLPILFKLNNYVYWLHFNSTKFSQFIIQYAKCTTVTRRYKNLHGWQDGPKHTFNTIGFTFNFCFVPPLQCTVFKEVALAALDLFVITPFSDSVECFCRGVYVILFSTKLVPHVENIRAGSLTALFHFNVILCHFITITYMMFNYYCLFKLLELYFCY